MLNVTTQHGRSPQQWYRACGNFLNKNNRVFSLDFASFTSYMYCYVLLCVYCYVCQDQYLLTNLQETTSAYLKQAITQISKICILCVWTHTIQVLLPKSSQGYPDNRRHKARSHEAHCNPVSMRIRSESNWMRIRCTSITFTWHNR